MIISGVPVFSILMLFLFLWQEVTLSGNAQLALHRRNIDNFAQTVTIRKTVGDKSGLFHIGPQQTLFADFQQDSPLLQFGTFIYNGGVLKAEGVLTVNAITIELEGTLDDIEELIIGPMGNVILRYFVDINSTAKSELQMRRCIDDN